MIQQLDVGGIVIGVVGGLAFFLFGLDPMTDALKVVARQPSPHRPGANDEEPVQRGDRRCLRHLAQEPNRLAAFRIETDIMENLKRIYYLAKRIAKIAAAVEGERDERDARMATAVVSASEDTGL